MRTPLYALLFAFSVLVCNAQSSRTSTHGEAEYYVAEYAQHYRLPIAFVRAVVAQESGWRACAVSSKGAAGLMQLMPQRTPASRRAFLCCFLRLDGSTCPLMVGAGHIQPSNGLPMCSHPFSRIALTRGVIGSTRRAAAVFPCVTSSVPFRPFTQVIDSQRRR
jgi:hypothetical protein